MSRRVREVADELAVLRDDSAAAKSQRIAQVRGRPSGVSELNRALAHVLEPKGQPGGNLRGA